MKPLTFGSLFAGIGGLDLGLERAGMQCKWQVEIDDYATKVLEKNFPNVFRHRDIKTFLRGWDDKFQEPVEIDLEPFKVDVICGGFPCQDVSLAGDQAGIEEGERSGLWREFARIIRVLRPQYVVVENVLGLLSANAGRNMGIVLGDLAAAGFDAEWTVLSADQFGLPHRRERVFIIAYPKRPRRRRILRGDESLCREANNTGGRDSSDSLDSIRALVQRIEKGLGEPGVFPSNDGLSFQVERLTAHGNAVAPAKAEWVGKQIISERSAAQ